MSWANQHIQKLLNNETVSFRPHGSSMEPIIKSGDLCIVVPVADENDLNVGDIVLCKVNGKQYLHLIKEIKEGQFLIGNNKGNFNGWIFSKNIFGKLIKVEQ